MKCIVAHAKEVINGGTDSSCNKNAKTYAKHSSVYREITDYWQAKQSEASELRKEKMK